MYSATLSAISPVQVPGSSSGIVFAINFESWATDLSPARACSYLPLTPSPFAPWQDAHVFLKICSPVRVCADAGPAASNSPTTAAQPGGDFGMAVSAKRPGGGGRSKSPAGGFRKCRPGTAESQGMADVVDASKPAR